jgi:tetratricopeptide (TPR) repeat protein
MKRGGAYEIPLGEYDFSRPPMYEYDSKLDRIENIKRKGILIGYGMHLTSSLQFNDAILFYKYLSNNSYFRKDYYPYRKLAEIYDEIDEPAAGLVNIKRLLHARIYLNDYQFIWFSERIRQLMSKASISEHEVQGWIDYYNSHGALLKKRQDPFLADRFRVEDDRIIVMGDDEFTHRQDRLALEERGLIYERVGNLDLAIRHYSSIISTGKYNYCHFYRRLCICLDRTGDYGREAKAIRLYFRANPVDRTKSGDEWFRQRLESVENKLKSSLDFYL